MDTVHDTAVRAQFGRRAAAYTASASHAGGPDLALLLDWLDLRGDGRVLDVATGTGHTALALAPHCAAVTGLDPTPEMLGEAEALAATRGIANVRWVEGQAEALPFADSTFEVVTVRRAPHHFASIPAALAEMRRVLVPGGRLGLVDQLTPGDPEGFALQEWMERHRDPSHCRALSVPEWRQALAEAGFAIRRLEVDEERCSFRSYLDRADTPAADRAAIAERVASASAAALAAIGYSADPAPGGSFLKQRVVVLATVG